MRREVRRELCVGRMLRLGIVLMNSGHDRRTAPSRTSRRGRQSDDLAAGSVVPLEWTTMYPFSGCRSFVTGASSWRTSRRRTGGRLRGGEGSLPWFLLLCMRCSRALSRLSCLPDTTRSSHGAPCSREGLPSGKPWLVAGSQDLDGRLWGSVDDVNPPESA